MYLDFGHGSNEGKSKTFHDMIEILNQEELKKKMLVGKPNILSVEDRLLMALEYLREYRTYFYIASRHNLISLLQGGG